MSLARDMNTSGSTARDINDQGQVVGFRHPFGSGWHAYLWCAGNVTDLGVLPEGDQSEARAINNRGEVVGRCRIPDPGGGGGFVYRAFLWSGDAMQDLGVLPGYSDSYAWDINDAGAVVGYCYSVGLPNRAFLWQDGVMHSVSSLIDPGLGLDVHLASAISDRGEITGQVVGLDIESLSAIVVRPPSPTDLTGDCQTGTDDLLALLGQWAGSGSRRFPTGTGRLQLRISCGFSSIGVEARLSNDAQRLLGARKPRGWSAAYR